MIHPDMSADEYHALPAVSASMLGNAHKKCPAYAWAYSSLNPKRLPEKVERYFDKGKAAHYAILEPALMESMVLVGQFDDFRTNAAREFRDEARAVGKVPILQKDADVVAAMHKSLRASEAAELLFGEGQSEVSYEWSIPYPAESAIGYQFKPGEIGMLPLLRCKARVDRLQGSTLIDLKTAESATPEAFDSAVLAYGHHQRAAWYKDGWEAQEEFIPRRARSRPHRYYAFRYLYVVVENDPPHLVGIYECSERAEEWGRRLNKAMLVDICHGLETGVWRGYQGGTRDLRPWVEHQYEERIEEGLLK